MARNRVIYNSEALFAGQKCGSACYTEDEGVNSIKQLHRVQSANYSFNISRTDINQFGELAAIDRIITDTPTVALDFSYYVNNMANEEALGFNVGQANSQEDPFGDDNLEGLDSSVKFLLDKTKDQRNYFIQTSKEGQDAAYDELNVNKSVIGIGNAFLTSYGVEASVGGLPTASVSVEGLNMSFESGNVLKAKGFSNNDYAASWSTSDGTRPVLYDGDGEKIDFAQGFDTSGYTFASQSPTAWRYSGVSLPSINPVDGTKSNGVFFLPSASGHAGADTSGILQLSTVRPGDIRIYFREVSQGGQAGLSGYNSSSQEFSDFKDAQVPGLDLPTQSGYSRDYPNGGDVTSAHIQSFSLNFGLSRTPLQRLGVKYAYSREIDFPVNVSLSVDAIAADLTTGNLSDLINCDKSFDVAIEMCAPADCVANPTSHHDLRSYDGRVPVATYIIKNAKLDSQSFSSSIGSNKSVTLDFSSQIGGPNQSGNGLFMKGFTPGNYSPDNSEVFAATSLAFPTESA